LFFSIGQNRTAAAEKEEVEPKQKKKVVKMLLHRLKIWCKVRSLPLTNFFEINSIFEI
jgi:hypothetical protein